MGIWQAHPSFVHKYLSVLLVLSMSLAGALTAPTQAASSQIGDLRAPAGRDPQTLILPDNIAIATGGGPGQLTDIFLDYRSHTCSLTSDGEVKCWGGNSFGQLGDGTTIDRLRPVSVIGLSSRVIALAAGGAHTCALTSSGGVKCWGLNHDGQLGDGTIDTQPPYGKLTPVDVTGLGSGVIALTAGRRYTCALTGSGGVKCWGDRYGQLPMDVIGLSNGVTAIAAGTYHTCALTIGGEVKCWGENLVGQLGDGTTPWDYDYHFTPVDVVGLSSGVTAIAAGTYHTCALTIGGGVKCWGGNFYGQLGDGTTTFRTTPIDVLELGSGVTMLTAGGGHTCALIGNGAVKCWGENTYGQLGDGTRTDRYTPTDVSGLSSAATALAAGHQHTCALIGHGGVRCWGDNAYGELGDGTGGTFRLAPADVSGLGSGVSTLSAGVAYTCALTSGGGVKCWGQNTYGQLGDGTRWIDRYTPVDVIGLSSGVTAIAASSNHTCALTIGGGVKCWGTNYNGQVGDGTTIDRLTPVDVSGLGSGVIALVAGSGHNCALTSDGGIKCWGYNFYGQLGDGTATDRLTPIDVSGLNSGVTAIAAKGIHTCALTSAGGVKCWGGNYSGQLGDGTATGRLTPVDVSGLNSGVIALTAGYDHTCALTSAGGVKCWGRNSHGQLGDGTTIDRLTPVGVNGLGSGITALAAGSSHTCALTSAGGVKCWGGNYYGQLGDGTTIDRLTPVDVIRLSHNVTMLTAGGGQHTCALTSGGEAKCWGHNWSGELGVEGRIRVTPVDVIWFIASTSTTLPTGGGALISTVDNTAYTFPADAFTETVIITHTVPFPENVPSVNNLAGAGHAFDVTAVYSSTGQPAQPTQAYTLTIQYTDAEKGAAIEGTLALYGWDGSQWVREASSTLDTATNTLTATPDHFSMWAVLGETYRILVPTILRD